MNTGSGQHAHDAAERIFIQVDEEVNNSTGYKKLESEMRELGRRIMEQLGPDRALFLDYEKLVYFMEGFRLESAYEIGFDEISCPGRCRPICRPKD